MRNRIAHKMALLRPAGFSGYGYGTLVSLSGYDLYFLYIFAINNTAVRVNCAALSGSRRVRRGRLRPECGFFMPKGKKVPRFPFMLCAPGFQGSEKEQIRGDFQNGGMFRHFSYKI
ncbi:hypothetical protein EQM14_15625 [Caproiciproducens sp. NJN-50]|uniref:hypothetical protein n=1 Tax=Acutalibacteraceae TaxID=3082771 RepID=UPI000FFE25DD|nr:MULTISPECIES: hypothetical protein [Acutalibacteraceae]QAT51083.1 hypothetical protein EQM14_15625 [Caproiciproducens sp. NJN-50]